MFAKTMIFVNRFAKTILFCFIILTKKYLFHCSAINPIIYSACSIKFRREFKRMLTCNHKPSYYYNRSGHRMVGGNGTTVSGATEMYFGDGAAGGLRANRSGAGAAAALRPQSGSQLHYSSVSNLATSGVGRGGGLLTTTALSTRRESDFLSPSHALIGYETRMAVIGPKGAQKNGALMKTSASIGCKLATVTAKTGSCTRSSSESESLRGRVGGDFDDKGNEGEGER